MITLITGAPGAGKTAALVDLLQSIVKSGRAIYVDGIPELTLPHELMEDARKWPELVPDGAAVVIDEVQRIWRPTSSGSKVSPEIEALETHRHKGLDFFIITQHPNLVHQNVRRLVGRHIHLRDVGFMGRWWYEWPEATDPALFRSAPVKKKYTLPKAVFGSYKSASLHVKPIRSIPRSVILLGVCLVVGAYLGWSGYQSISAKVNPPKVEAKPRPAPASGEKAGEGWTANAARATAPPVPASAPEPVVVGCIAMPKRCTCLDATGTPLIVAWEACQESARGFGGLVKLAMESKGSPMASLSLAKPQELPTPQAPALVSLGGDPRAHIR